VLLIPVEYLQDYGVHWVLLLQFFFANAGGAYGIARGFNGYVALGRTPRVDRTLLIKGLVPAIMASVRGVYGLIIAILIATQFDDTNYSMVRGFEHLFAGLCVGLSGWASGYCMGVIGDVGLTAVSQKPRLYIHILLIVIFCEAIGLYGLIISLILVSKGSNTICNYSA